MPKSARSSTEPAFETALAELEAIVARMEEGRLGLEESLQSYRRGAELVRYCQSKLSDAEQQVRILEAELLKPFADESTES
jgi:exodeoxyribonuclease VII small subunit